MQIDIILPNGSKVSLKNKKQFKNSIIDHFDYMNEVYREVQRVGSNIGLWFERGETQGYFSIRFMGDTKPSSKRIREMENKDSEAMKQELSTDHFMKKEKLELVKN